MHIGSDTNELPIIVNVPQNIKLIEHKDIGR